MSNWINSTSFGSEVDFDFKMLYDWAEAYHSGKSNQKKTDSEIYSHILDILDKYFEITKNLVGEIQNSERDNFALESELEEWLFFPAHHVVPSCEDSEVVKYHPLILMNDIYQEEAEKKLTRLKENSCLEYNIAKEILESKVANRAKLVLRHGEKDYKLKKDGSLKLFETYGSLTDIQEIRIIEKIESIQKRKNKRNVYVAYFGTLEEKLKVKCYFKDDDIILDDFKYYEGHFFNNKFGNIELNDINTLQILLERYDLVLFLDESYFYKKYQSHKTAREDNRALYVDWYWSNAKRYQQDILAKMNMYFALYEEARKFLDDKVNVLSSNYEFDDRLFKRLEGLSSKIGEKCADIYLYINYGKIADRSIENENVCKDEMYDGKSINVYKIGGESASYNKTVQNALTIDYWKMIKSISNYYYIDYWKDYDIRTLKNNYLEIVDGKMKKGNDKTELCIYYYYKFEDNNKDNNALIDFTNALFSIVKGSAGMDCVKSYVKNMLAESILSRADKVADILLAYLIPRKMNIIFEEKEAKNQRQGSQELSYRKRKMIYNIIEKLDNLLLRDVDQLESTIFYDIKPSFAAEISDNDFYEYLEQINNACKEIGDNDSRLSLYSSRLILNTKKANNSAE